MRIPAFGLALLAVSGLVACLFQTQVIEPTSPHLHYRLRVSPGAPSQAEVTITFLAWPQSKAKTFLLPSYYADNPVWPVPGLDVSSINMRDAQGKALSSESVPSFGFAGDTSQPLGPTVTLPNSTETWSYQLDLDTLAPSRLGLAIPNLLPGLQLLDGANLFALPILASPQNIQAAEIWREPMEIDVKVEIPDGQASLGMAVHEKLSSPYELMFLRSVVGRPRQVEKRLMLQRGLTPVTVFATTSDTVNLQTLADSLPRYLTLVEDMFGPLPSPFLAIGEVGGLGGLEGRHGYWFGTPYANYPEVHLHELIHLWVGIICGDRDQPWFKEGVTTYLGQWLTVRGGWMTLDAWQAYMEGQAQDTLGPVAEVALTNLNSRLNYYRPLNHDYLDGISSPWYQLVYGKGPQAALLIDAYMLEASQGQVGLPDLVRNLYEHHRPGFTRIEMVASMKALTGEMPRAWLDQLLDNPGPIKPETIKAAFATLRHWRKF